MKLINADVPRAAPYVPARPWALPSRSLFYKYTNPEPDPVGAFQTMLKSSSDWVGSDVPPWTLPSCPVRAGPYERHVVTSAD